MSPAELRLLFDSGPAGPGGWAGPRDLRPLEQRIDELLRQGDLQAVYDLAAEFPRVVGDLLGNYGLALAQWEECEPELLRKLLVRTWNRLDAPTKKQFLHLMINMVYRVSRSELLRKGIPTGEVTTVPFSFEGDEIDLDQTLEARLEHPVWSYENIFVLDRKKYRRAAVIMMDASGSMQGEKLSLAAIAVASLALNLDARDEYGVVLFSEKAKITKRVDQALPLDRVLNEILNLRPEGRTNLELGISTGLRELQRSTIEGKIGILLTDGQQNVGGDPLPPAGRFPKLHVINLPGGKAEFAKKIAACGRGSYVALQGMHDVPKAILQCLRWH
ncbi:MAG: VWA domain-containing protein [Deltaproteobacteria bacterium]|nr:VWA domain-containing protein [Deltaproteobacteria bacterium]